MEKFVALFTDKIIATSGAVCEEFVKAKVAALNKFTTIYSGIDIGQFRGVFDVVRKKQEFGIKPADLVVGVVSKLWEGKGHRCILQAAKSVVNKVPNVKFMVVGEGYLREELEALTKQLGLSNFIIFTGFRADIPQINAIFDIAILASFYEGLGRVLLEAMAVGKPVIATKVGGIVDVVDDGKNGILVPPGDSDALAEAMIRLLSKQDLRNQMGQAGKAKVDEKFSAKTMVDKIDRLYEELIIKKIAYTGESLNDKCLNY